MQAQAQERKTLNDGMREDLKKIASAMEDRLAAQAQGQEVPFPAPFSPPLPPSPHPCPRTASCTRVYISATHSCSSSLSFEC